MQMMYMVPLLCLGMGVLPRAAAAWKESKPAAQTREIIQPQTGPYTWMGSSQKMNQKQLDAVFDYYVNPPVKNGNRETGDKIAFKTETHQDFGSTKTLTSAKKQRLKQTPMVLDAKVKPRDEQVEISKILETKHKKCDGVVAETEIVAAAAVGVVCLIAVMVWRSRYSEEAYLGINSELHNMGPPGEFSRHNSSGVSTKPALLPTEMSQEELMLEASKRIARAKAAQEKYLNSMNDSKKQDDQIGESSSDDVAFKQEKAVLEVKNSSAPVAAVQEVSLSTEVKSLKPVPVPDQKLEIIKTESSVGRENGAYQLGAFTLAVISVIGSGLAKELKRSMTKTVYTSHGRVLQVSFRKGQGKALMLQTAISEIPLKETAVGTKDRHWKLGEILVAPAMPLIKSSWDLTHPKIFADKYNPISEFQKSIANMGIPQQGSLADPMYAILHNFPIIKGFPSIKGLQKYDPVQNIDAIEVHNSAPTPVRRFIDSAPPMGAIEHDPIRQLLRAAALAKGLRASKALEKYDPLQSLDTFAEGLKGGERYSFVQALIEARPSNSDFDLWKDLARVEPPEVGALEHSKDPIIKFLQQLKKLDPTQQPEIHFDPASFLLQKLTGKEHKST